MGTLNTDTLEFVASHRPPLESGPYAVDAVQTIQGQDFVASVRFHVAGPRFQIDAADIHSMFPPSGSLGDHSLVLPHIVLRRSTLPWERRAVAGADTPWLALLLFDECEALQAVVSKVGDVAASLGTGFALDAAAGESPDDKVATIPVPVDLLKKLLPSAREIELLSHVRRAPSGDELAVVLCGRLPRSGASSTMHLVSVENRLVELLAEKSGVVTLVSLATWRFSCPADGPQFKDEMLALDKYPHADDAAKWPGGRVPLRHRLRNGQRTVSLYRGPLGRGLDGTVGPPEVFHADELLGQDGVTRMLDVSYAAAWELGRLLTIADKHVSSQLFLWKRRHAQGLRALELPLFRPRPGQADLPDVPQAVADWFDDLRLLKPVPFDYLAPDERLLPPESIWFFQIDPGWIQALQAGAFAVGPVSSAPGTAAKLPDMPVLPEGVRSGFLLRSAVVTQYPEIDVDGWRVAASKDVTPEEADRVKMESRRIVSPGILLCLFDGDLASVDFHRKPEELHCGFAEKLGRIEKSPRDSHGIQSNLPIPCDAMISDLRRVAVDRLATQIGVTTSAEFALAMIEGVDRIRFNRSGWQV